MKPIKDNSESSFADIFRQPMIGNQSVQSTRDGMSLEERMMRMEEERKAMMGNQPPPRPAFLEPQNTSSQHNNQPSQSMIY
jgi:hypothetical protein